VSTHETPALATWGKWDKAALQLILVGGVIYALVVAVAGVAGLVGQLTSGERMLTLFVEGNLPASAAGGSATLLEGSYESATVTVAGLTPATAGLLTAGGVIGFVTQLLVAASFVYLAWRLLRREPFLRSLTWTFIVAGAVLLIGTLLGQAASGFGSWLVATELNDGMNGFWPLMMRFDPAPIGLAFILMLVGCAFEYGQKLTNETRGLV
jgi:hypothetical protein